jgi:hypothetical protein
MLIPANDINGIVGKSIALGHNRYLLALDYQIDSTFA